MEISVFIREYAPLAGEAGRAFRIDPVDTTGAGDAFCGALAAALSQEERIEHALVRACAAGAVVAQHRGATTSELSPASIAALVLSR